MIAWTVFVRPPRVSSAAMNSPRSAVHIHIIGADEAAALPAIQKIPAHYDVTFEGADFSKAMPGVGPQR